MNKEIKLIGITMVLLLGLLGFTALVSAESDLYNIIRVEVNGIRVSNGADTVHVELSDPTEIDVWIDGTGNVTFCPDGDVDDCAVEVKVRAWIGGYEYDDIEATSDTFAIEPGVSYKETLTLDVPADLDVEDQNDFTLYVEVYDSSDEERESYNLFVERPRHTLDIVDVIYDQSVTAGDFLGVEVRVENLGEKKEEDIKVSVALEDLATDATYIDELAAFEEENEDEEDSDSVWFLLEVPEDAIAGDYSLEIVVSYNNGYDSIEQTYSVEVESASTEVGAEEEAEEPEETEPTTSLSSTSLEGTAGETTSMTVTITNTGSETETFTVSAQGITQWATSTVTPSSVTIDAGTSEQVTIAVTPNDDATGSYTFSVQVVDAAGELVEDVSVTMTVEEGTNGWLSDSSSLWKAGFIVLIVLIVIIGLIIALRKLKDEDEEEPLEPKEGKTYY